MGQKQIQILNPSCEWRWTAETQAFFDTAGDVDFTDTIKKHKERQPVKKKHWWSK
jgi:hypothetical protein